MPWNLAAFAAFKAISDDQLALYDLDSSVVAQLQANQVQIDALMSLVKDGMEQLGDSTLPQLAQVFRRTACAAPPKCPGG